MTDYGDFHELIKLAWHASIDKANILVELAEDPGDIIAFGLAFVMGSAKLGIAEQDMYDCFKEFVAGWKAAGGRFGA